MYKVFFNSLEIYNADSLEDALAFALNFHRASNVPHTIKVYDPMNPNCDCIISLVRKSRGEASIIPGK